MSGWWPPAAGERSIGPYRVQGHSVHRVWNGEYHPDASGGSSMLELTYTPKAAEMSPAVPEWARKEVEGKLKWRLSIDPGGTCGKPSLVATFYPGLIKWRDGGEKKPGGAWVAGEATWAVPRCVQSACFPAIAM